MAALQNFPQPEIAAKIISAYESFSSPEQAEAQAVLSTRAQWAKEMIVAATDGRLDAVTISIDVLRKCLLFDDAELTAAIQNHWGEVAGVSSAQMKSEISRVTRLIESSAGDVYK